MTPDLTTDELDWLRGCFDLARDGQTDEVAHRLRNGVPVNLTNHRGDTLLMLATYYQRHSVAELLLQSGADVERVNDEGQTALGAAVFRRSDDLVQLLLRAGADPDTGTRSARAIARFYELSEMSELLDGTPTVHT